MKWIDTGELLSARVREDRSDPLSVIVDPAIKGATGHHLNTARALSNAARRFGHIPVWLCHKNLDTALAPDHVACVPAFSSTIYENQIGLVGRAVRPLIGNRKILRKGLRERAWEIELRRRISSKLLMGDRQRELIEALRELDLTAADSIILPTADPQTVDMLVSWCRTHPRSAQPHIHIRTCWADSNIPYAAYGGGFSSVIPRLAAVSRHLTLSTETEEGAEFWSRKTGFKFEVCGCIVDMNRLPAVDGSPAKKPIVIAWLGEARVEKGADILPEIIERVVAGTKVSEVRFLVQGSGKRSRKAIALDAQLARFGDVVVRLPFELDPSAYASALSRSHILLLPYDPLCYPATRGSGMAVEGLLTAKPLVATRGTFAATLINCGNGVIGSNVEELASGALQIVSDFEKFYLRSLQARELAISDYDLLSIYQRMTVTYPALREAHQ